MERWYPGPPWALQVYWKANLYINTQFPLSAQETMTAVYKVHVTTPRVLFDSPRPCTLFCCFGLGSEIHVIRDVTVFWSLVCTTEVKTSATFFALWALFMHVFSSSPERKKGAKCGDAPTGPLTLLLYYSFDGSVEGVEILNRTWEMRSAEFTFTCCPFQSWGFWVARVHCRIV